MNISQFTYKDVTFDVTFNNGFLAYTFNYLDKTYGIKLDVSGRKVLDISSVAFQLALNAIETYENIRLREGNTKARPKTKNSTKSK